MAKEDITTKFKVDISDLKKGISEANRQIKLANAEFKAASSGMDNWQKSADGISAKIQQLQSILVAQEKKLENYKNQLKALQGIYAENEKKVEQLTKAQKQAEESYGANSKEAKEYAKQLDDANDELNRSKVAIENMTITMKNQEGTVNSVKKDIASYEQQLDSLGDESEETGNELQSLDKSLKGVDTNTLTQGFTVMKGALANLVADGIRKAIDGLKEFASSMVTTAAEVKAENAQFAQTFGDMGDEAEKAISRVAESTGVLDTRLKASATGIYGFAKASGADVPEAMDLMETSLNVAADTAAYYDRSLEDSTQTLQSFLKGNFENDAALGVSATEFTRNAKAVEMFGVKYNELSEIQKQQTLLQMVVDAQKASGAFGQAARESDGWENVMGNLNETWRQFTASVGEPFLEALIPVIQDVTASFQDWAESVDWEAFGKSVGDALGVVADGFQWIIDNKDIIISAVAGMVGAFVAQKIISFGSGLTSIISSIPALIAGLQSATTVQGAFNAVMNANPIGLVITAIGALIAIITMLILNWDSVKQAAIQCWEKIQAVWGTVSTWFNTNVIQPVIQFFTTAWQTITQVFSTAKASIQQLWNTVSTWFNTNVIQPIKKFFGDMWTNIQTAAQTAWNSVKGIWQGVSTWFNTNVIQPVKKFFGEMWNSLKTSAKTAWNTVKNIFAPVTSWFSNTFSQAWQAVKNVFSGWGSFFGGLWQEISDKFSAIGTEISDAISGAVRSGINGVISSVENVVNSGISIVNGAIRLINKIPGVSIGTIGGVSFPRLERGGILKKGQIGFLEGTGSEAVVPLDQNRFWISTVVKELKDQLNLSDVLSTLKSEISNLMDTITKEQGLSNSVNNSSSNINNFTQIINAPTSPNRAEIYRDTKNLLSLVKGA